MSACEGAISCLHLIHRQGADIPRRGQATIQAPQVGDGDVLQRVLARVGHLDPDDVGIANRHLWTSCSRIEEAGSSVCADEQLARDARITTLYEGTTGIQALDLLGRKVMQLKGTGLKLFLGMIEQFCNEQSGNSAVAEFIGPLREKAAQWQQLTLQIGQRAAANPEEIGAAAYDYLMYSGYVTLAYWWARSVAAAEASSQSEKFKSGKRETARFFFARILPRTLAHTAAIATPASTLTALDEAAFDS